MFTKDDGPRIQNEGLMMAKKRNPVYLLHQQNEFEVKTNEGVLKGKAGDYLAHDPTSGHVWPVSADYVKMHYEKF